ncbi:carboxypeptidase-like regulatory domain-containing protein [Hyunsoonleella flava]|uniref:Carboxypeptidase-like regulatory domain-containing protein n=1 Tax=Hyunsoonleella flava TaxID=2527939 RepID=A0A4Q9FIZ1_9FLAO|nr:carboxypeptidase-like regulatory domain-containing protein [Hyunsoonleella flava]TBN03202.1 carboxypeptidase-like regulatory domain-containing protein [Hyunsoonleella flava]
MKYFLFTVFLFTAMFTSAQNGTINGKITDAEEGNTPLLFAKVIIKETGEKVMTDETGAFKFENVKEGTYTLVCSFTGYDTKEIKTEVTKEIHEPVKLALAASTVSLDDLAMVFASSEKKENTISNN